ncbi:uncharacterized protein BP5553_01608 [Venustampulla echinocandica]|uniref:Uncharacterized protein n=1 Tax=Venustampulla echinocandica TaxID=2656787 RepID=A0A370U1H4_9HELO|nr:uncharacterized protein BP5553_01608 [Venustampulla echinocandica]RDL41629.1 hypothetical protein BP5553_01608 [Venustampulla echinocandica]
MEQNVKKLLKLAGGEELARQLLNLFAKWNELLLLTGDDLDDLEEVWTGRSRTATESPAPSTCSEFYVLIETKTFINISWNIVRELTDEGCTIMQQNSAHRDTPVPPLWLSRPTLHRGYHLHMPLSVCSTGAKRSDHAPPIETLAFGSLRRPRLPEFIQKFHKISKRKEKTQFIIPSDVYELPPKQRSDWIKKRYTQDRVPAPEDLSFIRNSEATGLVSEKDPHEESRCARCILGSKYDEKLHRFTASGATVFSAYGLVISLNLTAGSLDRHDICLFAVSDIPEVVDDKELTVIVEDLLQSGYGYHTIRHPIPQGLGRSFNIWGGEALWNLPLHYRPFTSKERIDATDWVSELKCLPISESTEKWSTEFCWDGLQMLLHYLGKGKPWAEAAREIKLKDRSTSTCARREIYAQSDKEDKQRRREADEMVEPRPIVRWGPLPASTRGD